MFVKENVALGKFKVDKDDNSVMRTEPQFRAMFENAGLEILEQFLHKDFPSYLDKISCYVLKVKAQSPVVVIGESDDQKSSSKKTETSVRAIKVVDDSSESESEYSPSDELIINVTVLELELGLRYQQVKNEEIDIVMKYGEIDERFPYLQP